MEIEEAKKRAKSGPLMLLAKRAFAILITFISTITVARLVSPLDYGLANMAFVVLAFAQIFRDFGLTNAVLRKGTIDQEELSFIFWFNAIMTLVLTLIIAGLSPFAARFYDEPVVTWVILVSLIGFLISGLSGQHRALIGRDLRFGVIAVIDSLSLAIGFVTTVVLASIYHNVWALVSGTVVQSIVASVGTIHASRWRPGRIKRIADLKSLLKFGANSSVFSISVFFSNNAGPVLIGHFLGAAMLGQYNRAEALFRLPITNLVQPITQATMPLLTRLRAHPEEYRLAYLGLIRRLCTVLFPASVILAFSAIPLVEALLGERWGQAGQVLAALAPTLVGIAVASAASDLFITQDRSAELRSLGLIEMTIRVGAIGIAVNYGIIATAYAFSVSTLVVVALRVIVAGRKGPVSIKDQISASFPSLPLTIASGLACAIARHEAPDYFSSPIGLATAIIFSGVAAGTTTALCVRASRTALFEVLGTFGLGKLPRTKGSRRAER